MNLVSIIDLRKKLRPSKSFFIKLALFRYSDKVLYLPSFSRLTQFSSKTILIFFWQNPAKVGNTVRKAWDNTILYKNVWYTYQECDDDDNSCSYRGTTTFLHSDSQPSSATFPSPTVSTRFSSKKMGKLISHQPYSLCGI